MVLACLADAGIHELRPIRPGSWLVPGEQLAVPRTIERILSMHLGQLEIGLADVATDRESWRPLEGGYVLQHNDELVIEPTCCGDLGNLGAWRSAVDAAEDSWVDLYLGHPWRSARRSGTQIEISQMHEDCLGGQNEPLTEELRVDIADLGTAGEVARHELLALADRLYPVLAPYAADPAPVVRGLVGLDRL